MRNREVIEREMYRAREDLEASLVELKQVVSDKTELKARARVAFAKGKIKAQDAFARGKTRSRALAVRGKDGAIDAYNAAKARPVLVGAIVGGVIAVGAFAYIGRQRSWW